MRLQVGDLTVERVNELDSWPFPTAEMFPGVRPEVFDEPELDFCIATYLVRTPRSTILVDAGNGNAKPRPVLTAHAGFDTDYLDRLAAVVDPAEVDVVVCTHLHPDHCGGLTRLVQGEWRPTFPRARHLVPRVELSWVEALAGQPDPEGPVADLARTFDDSVRPVLEAGLVEAIDVPATVTDEVVLAPAPGHTPGHVVVELRSGDEQAVISGDLIHHPFQLADLSLPHSGDADPVASASSRRRVVAELAASGGLLLPAHFDPGRIQAVGEGYRYDPVAAA